MRKWHYVASMVLLVAIYLLGSHYFKDGRYTETITMVLAIIAVVAFWMELKSNERINEAQLVMELNDQFVTNEQFSNIEWELEKYYAAYIAAKDSGRDSMPITLSVDLSLQNKERQYLVNYLVHLEGIAALVNEGVLHLNVITDLMAYRYFIAVNNPIVQELELYPYRDYYHGIFRIYEKWSKELGTEKVPMREYGLLAPEAKCYHRRSGE